MKDYRPYYISLLLILLFFPAGCASDRYWTQRGAVIGAVLGAGYGQALGRDTESTLLGTALGGLTGAVIGNYADQKNQYERTYRRPDYVENRRTYYTSPPPSRSYVTGQWVGVQGQYVGNQYVPPNQVWVSAGQSAGVVVERR